jgi:PRC-barrel domain
MIDSNGNVMAAIVSVGGFLGVGQKDVVIPFKGYKSRRAMARIGWS